MLIPTYHQVNDGKNEMSNLKISFRNIYHFCCNYTACVTDDDIQVIQDESAPVAMCWRKYFQIGIQLLVKDDWIRPRSVSASAPFVVFGCLPRRSGTFRKHLAWQPALLTKKIIERSGE